MADLELRNDQALVLVSRDSQLTLRAIPEGTFCGTYQLDEGYVIVGGTAPLSGLLYYHLPSVYESLVVRKEGDSRLMADLSTGHWPPFPDEDELDTFPYLHLLEERKTGIPWRFERWYTLAGPILVYDSECYFERSCQPSGGRDWERFVVELRQVIDLPALSRASGLAAHLLTVGEPGR